MTSLNASAIVLGPFDARKKRVMGAIAKLENMLVKVSDAVRCADGTIGDLPSRVIYDHTEDLIAAIDYETTRIEHLHQKVLRNEELASASERGGPDDL